MEEKPTPSPPSNGDIEMEKASSSQAEHKDIQDASKEAYAPHDDFIYPTPQEEAAVIRKIDWRLMPLVFVLYMLSVLDRSNLGNAKLAGLEDGEPRSRTREQDLREEGTLTDNSLYRH